MAPAHDPVELVDPTRSHYTLSPPVADVTGPRPLATIVLPCHNEVAHVVREIERITAAMDTSGMSYELLVIDDASTDRTLSVLQEALPRFPRMRLMPFRRNGGSGTARRIGTREARGEIVMWANADLSCPNERIPEFVRYLVEHPGCAQVVGARYGEQGARKRPRLSAGRFVHKIAEALVGVRIADLDSGMRAFRREPSLPLLRLLPAGDTAVSTITLAFLANQHDVDYLPIDVVKRSGRPRVRPLRDAYRSLLQVVRMVMSFGPLEVLLPPALVLLLLGVAKGVYDVIVHPFHLHANTLLLFVIGLVIGSVALLADLVARDRS